MARNLILLSSNRNNRLLRSNTTIPPRFVAQNKNDVQAETESVCVPELHLFQVQVGAFRQQANAEQLAQKLSVQGLPVELVPAGNLIQVRAGGLFFRTPSGRDT